MDSDEGWVRRREKTLITADVIVIVLQEGMKRAQVDGEGRDSRGSERVREKTIFLLTSHSVISLEKEGESWQAEDLLVVENVSQAGFSFTSPFLEVGLTTADRKK